MKFYLTEITTYNDGTKDAVGLYTYEDYDSSLATFHTKMGGTMKRDVVATELLCIINDGGSLVRSEKFTRPVPEPEPEPEVVEEPVDEVAEEPVEE